MEIAGYIASALIGIVLGLIGGGGSILTLPVLVFLFGLSPTQATGYSLFVVGATAALGSALYARQGLVHLRTALLFSPPSFLGVYLVRRFAMPVLPENLFSIGAFDVSRDRGIVVLFALLMVGTAYSMIRSKADPSAPPGDRGGYPHAKIAAEGLLVGGLTGLVGAGGGFLIVPALVILAKLPMKLAVGTSLLIIAVKSLVGFLGDVQAAGDTIQWGLLGGVTAVALVGLVAGTLPAKRVPGAKLKPAFGVFVLVMGVYMLGAEFLG